MSKYTLVVVSLSLMALSACGREGPSLSDLETKASTLTPGTSIPTDIFNTLGAPDKLNPFSTDHNGDEHITYQASNGVFIVNLTFACVHSPPDCFAADGSPMYLDSAPSTLTYTNYIEQH